MFTGIIKYNGIIIDITPYDKGLTISIFSEIEDIVSIGDSICVNGICLTVVKIIEEYTFVFNVMNETILKTTVKEWIRQQEVNLELSAKSNIIQLDGHIVSGHVDCVGELVDIQENVYFFSCPKELIPLIIDKGSITVDGTSLTISTCYDNIFTVSIIPLTLKWTIFRNYKIGSKVNLEGDCRLKQSNQFYGDIYSMIGKYILSDKHAMSIALNISENALNSAPPNPHVGCVIVKNKKIIGMGYHHSPGNSHAEIEAFNSCKEDVEGSELYVTLEPCCHIGRTGKCVDVIIKNKVKRVIVGVCDTDERVNNKSIQILRESGIVVDILNDENVIKSLTPYLYQRKYKKPYVYLKIATTLDNKCCAIDGTSKWITSEKSRLDSHSLREKVQCIITTSSTVIKDKPRLNIRNGNKAKNPLVVVLDFNNKLKDSDIEDCGWEKYIVWKDTIGSLLSYLYSEYNIISVLFECGTTLFNTILNFKMWNEMWVYMSMTTLGKNGMSSIEDITRGFNIAEKEVIGNLLECKQIENDIKLVLKNNNKVLNGS
jgi:riboflavin biosynthesis protein RibD/riboflavin synthase alpha subunit